MNSSPHTISTTTLHGVFLDVLGLGVLLTGPSGIGKSEVALGLINHGHRLIADDAVDFIQQNNGELIGHCHPILQDFLEIRGLGPLNVRAMFGDDAIKSNQVLHLIIHIEALSDEALINIDRVHGMHSMVSILDSEVPRVSIPVTPGRNMVILVEGAVRNQLLRMAGYHASSELRQRQRQYMSQNLEISE